MIRVMDEDKTRRYVRIEEYATPDYNFVLSLYRRCTVFERKCLKIS